MTELIERIAPLISLLPAVRLLILGGVANLVLSFLLGWILSAVRLRGPMEPHRWLLTAHEVSLQEGLMLIALGFATSYANLPLPWALAAARLLIIASFFQDFSGIVNWLRGTGDQFAERSAGWVLATINAVTNTAGLLIIAAGVVRAFLFPIPPLP